jgi:hypothetical protein
MTLKTCNGKPVITPPKGVQEVRNALKARNK